MLGFDVSVIPSAIRILRKRQEAQPLLLGPSWAQGDPTQAQAALGIGMNAAVGEKLGSCGLSESFGGLSSSKLLQESCAVSGSCFLVLL